MDDTSSPASLEKNIEQSPSAPLEKIIEQSPPVVEQRQEESPQSISIPLTIHQAQACQQISSSIKDEKNMGERMKETLDPLLISMSEKNLPMALSLRAYLGRNGLRTSLDLFMKKPQELLQSPGITLETVSSVNDFYLARYGARFASEELLKSVKMPCKEASSAPVPKPSLASLPQPYEQRQRRSRMAYGSTLQNDIRAFKLESLAGEKRIELRAPLVSFLRNIRTSYPLESKEVTSYISEHKMEYIEDLYIEQATDLANKGLSLEAIRAINLTFKKEYGITWISEMSRQYSQSSFPARSPIPASKTADDLISRVSSREHTSLRPTPAAAPHSLMESMPRSHTYQYKK